MSDLGKLSECLVDSDTDARLRARRIRSKALLLSVILEALLLAVLLLWPLLSPGALSAHYNVMPTPPYPGGGAKRQSPRTPRAYDEWRRVCVAVCAPVLRPQAPAVASEAPDIDASSNANSDSGPGLPGSGGPGIPGSIGDRPFVPEPPHLKPPPSRPLSVGGDVMAARLVQRIEPAYPAIARAAHISGVVHLHAIIGKDGSVRDLEAVDGNILLAQAAKTAVQRWRYRPTLLNGEPVEVDTYITVHFVLN
jgi:protein TonB